MDGATSFDCTRRPGFKAERLAVVAALVMGLFGRGTPCGCAEANNESTGSEAPQILQAGPHCGVYSLLAATSALGTPLPLVDLTSRRYVSSELGSSGADLAAAARNHGMTADFVTGLSEWDLRASDCPLVLRISSAERRDVFNHWVAYLGEEAGRARILDYPDPVMLYPFGELLSRWDGSAVVVSRSDLSASRIIWFSRLRGIVVFLVASIAAIFFAKAARGGVPSDTPPRARGNLSLRADTLAIAAASLTLAVSIDVLRPGGVLQNSHIAEAVAIADGVAPLPTVAVTDVLAALDLDEESLPVIVDARLPRDYVRGHIPRAINIPAWATLSSRRASIASIAKTADIIIYCQGPSCSYDKEIAAQFVVEGFRNVSLLRGGWEEWHALQSTPSRKQ